MSLLLAAATATIVVLLFVTASAAPNTAADALQRLHHPSGRIINGKEASPNQFPYQAFLEFHDNNGGTWYCSGSLTRSTLILTSGYCTSQAENVTVTLGITHRKPEDQEKTHVTIDVIDKTNIVTHPKFNYESNLYDIGIIVLPTPVALSDAINIVNLPEDTDNNTYANEIARISGWGYTDGRNDASASDVLLYTDSKVLTNEQCKKVFFPDLKDYQLCLAGDVDGTAACKNDYGGPLTITTENGKIIQIGIASFLANSFCLPGYPSGYTRTTALLNKWINDYTDIPAPPPPFV